MYVKQCNSKPADLNLHFSEYIPFCAVYNCMVANLMPSKDIWALSSKNVLDKYFMAIYLSMGRYHFFLLPHLGAVLSIYRYRF